MTKKYANISASVPFICGAMTSRIRRIFPIPSVAAAASSSGGSFLSPLYAMRYGEAKKCTVFASTSIANVPYMKVEWKKSTYERPSTMPGIASEVIASRLSAPEAKDFDLAVRYAHRNAHSVPATDVSSATNAELPRNCQPLFPVITFENCATENERSSG